MCVWLYVCERFREFSVGCERASIWQDQYRHYTKSFHRRSFPPCLIVVLTSGIPPMRAYM